MIRNTPNSSPPIFGGLMLGVIVVLAMAIVGMQVGGGPGLALVVGLAAVAVVVFSLVVRAAVRSTDG